MNKMSKMEKFIRDNFNLEADELILIPRIIARCNQEIEDSAEGRISEYELYDIVDDELYQILQEQGKISG